MIGPAFRQAVLAVLLLAVTSRAWAVPEGPCAAAIAAAEIRAGIPAGLLAAMGVVESGRPGPDGELQAWPWAMNSTGSGRLYDTVDDAIAATARLRQSGQSSIDVGCLQVNLLHHPTAFASLEEAFDPVRNVDYAARFLASLRTGSVSQDWMEAVGHYHSFRADLAEAYRARVQAVLARRPTWSGVAGPGWLMSARPVPRPAAPVPPSPPRPSGIAANDWLHLVTVQARQGWRAPEPGTTLSPDRAIALAGALDKLAVVRGGFRAGSGR